MILSMGIAITGLAHANIINAKSCSQPDVQAAIDSASSGDSVVVPSGSCEWAKNITISNSKKILFSGAGKNSTIITMNPPGTAIDATTSGSRITGFKIVNGGIYLHGDGWRIDNCEIYSKINLINGIYVRGDRETQHPTGLIDNCTFYNARVLIYGWAGLTAHSLWSQDVKMGSGDGVVYVENCNFTGTVFGNAIDSQYGGRYVFRFNTVTDWYLEAHSADAPARAAQKWEIYNNTITFTGTCSACSDYAPFRLRGGTGVVFNNTINGNWADPNILLDNVRSCLASGNYGKCDGNAASDGNAPGGLGWPCRDQIGRGSDISLWSGTNPYPSQSSEPAYAWNNKHGANDALFKSIGCQESASHIRSDRDFYNNIKKPGYTPYVYPHPLVSGWSAVKSPQNVHFK